MQLNELKQLLRDMGVVGAGGAGFPSYAKLSDKADTVILNCAECEPLLKVHRQVLEEFTSEILTALDTILKATGAKQGIIAIKSHYKSTLKALESEIGDFPALSIHPLESVYPAGDEIILIKEVTGKTVDPGKLPLTVGVTVCNVESVYNIFKAMQGAPVTHKYVTVAGEVAHPRTLCVPLGTKISELIASAGGETVDDAEYINGGPMMGIAIPDLELPIMKNTNMVLALTEKEARTPKTTACIRCGSCTNSCPFGIAPAAIAKAYENKDAVKLDELCVNTCMECGCCNFVCPANRPLVQANKLAKAFLRDEKAKEGKK